MFIFTKGEKQFHVYINRKRDVILCLYLLKERGHSLVLFTRGEMLFPVYIH